MSHLTSLQKKKPTAAFRAPHCVHWCHLKYFWKAYVKPLPFWKKEGRGCGFLNFLLYEIHHPKMRIPVKCYASFVWMWIAQFKRFQLPMCLSFLSYYGEKIFNGWYGSRCYFTCDTQSSSNISEVKHIQWTNSSFPQILTSFLKITDMSSFKLGALYTHPTS